MKKRKKHIVQFHLTNNWLEHKKHFILNQMDFQMQEEASQQNIDKIREIIRENIKSSF